jgi:hypothetical protein
LKNQNRNAIIILKEDEETSMMKGKVNRTIKVKQYSKYRRCNAITCINNIQGLCDQDECELYEKQLIQED